jgi:SnoaL-like domain
MDLQYLLDLEEIKQLRYSFAWCLETSAPEELADLFTTDGVIDVGPWGVMRGQEKIRKGYGRAYRDAEPWTAMHAVTNPRIRINGDAATGTWYLLDHNTKTAPGSTPTVVLGVYDEEYQKVNGEWKIASLTLRFKWSSQVGRVTSDNPMQMLAPSPDPT